MSLKEETLKQIINTQKTVVDAAGNLHVSRLRHRKVINLSNALDIVYFFRSPKKIVNPLTIRKSVPNQIVAESCPGRNGSSVTFLSG